MRRGQIVILQYSISTAALGALGWEVKGYAIFYIVAIHRYSSGKPFSAIKFESHIKLPIDLTMFITSVAVYFYYKKIANNSANFEQLCTLISVPNRDASNQGERNKF